MHPIHDLQWLSCKIFHNTSSRRLWSFALHSVSEMTEYVNVVQYKVLTSSGVWKEHLVTTVQMEGLYFLSRCDILKIHERLLTQLLLPCTKHLKWISWTKPLLLKIQLLKLNTTHTQMQLHSNLVNLRASPQQFQHEYSNSNSNS